MSKVLVSYFSASGVTRSVAQRIATAINGDIFEIEPVDMLEMMTLLKLMK